VGLLSPVEETTNSCAGKHRGADCQSGTKPSWIFAEEKDEGRRDKGCEQINPGPSGIHLEFQAVPESATWVVRLAQRGLH